MISTLIFSKNRACQLDLLLRSIEKNFSHISTDIKVLFCATTDEFMHGYDIIKERFSNVKLKLEFDFQDDTLKLLNKCDEHVCFFVDDNIVYRPPNIFAHQIEYLMKTEEAGCFSFRLGLNTTVQDPYSGKKVSPMPVFYAIEDAVLAWDWTILPQNNFGYPFSVDGHIYNTQLVLDTLNYEFDTPNAFEGRYPMKKIARAMFCLRESSVFNNPLNLVGSSNNKAGVLYGHALESLNEQYVNGKQIDLEYLCKNDIVGCHQEMEIKYG